MAKPSVKFIDAPAKNNVYVGMLALAVVAGLIGIGAFAIEANDYEWSNQAKASPTPTLPKLSGEAPDKAGGGNRPVVLETP